MIKIGRIGVLMGGLSSERDVSLKSGRAVASALKKSGIDVVAIDINPHLNPLPHGGEGRVRGCSRRDNLIRDCVLNKIRGVHADTAFIALHGKFGEDGTIQGILEENGIPYTGSGVMASRLAMDKVKSRELFKKAGLSVPNCIVLNSHPQNKQMKSLRNGISKARLCSLSRVVNGIASPSARNDNEGPARNDPRFLSLRGQSPWQSNFLPLIIKPSSQGSSIGLSLVETDDRLNEAIDLAYKYDDTVIVEEYISGKEVTVAILNDKPLPVINIVPGRRFYDYNAKYKSDSTRYICPAEIGRKEYKRVQDSALIAHKCLGCKSFSRVDMILNEDGVPVVLEVNTIPGLTSKSLLPKAAKAAGISFEELCIIIARSA